MAAGAIAMAIGLGVATTAGPASAQRYENSLRALDYATDVFARSPRLLGMGRLTLADDRYNHIDLWDFAGNPAGIAAAESVSVIEYRPGTRSTSSVRRLYPAARERQELLARQMRHGLEAWRRTEAGTGYGLIADVTTLQRGRPHNVTVEERESFVVPGLLAAVNGRMPWVPSPRFDYALHLNFTRESLDDNYFQILQLPGGEYLGQPTAGAPPPDVFTPDQIDVSNLGFGATVAMRVTPRIKVALGYERDRAKVNSLNEGLRSTSSTEERRPFNVLQATTVARIGRNLEIAADGRAWRGESEELFTATISAGQGQVPLAGEGKRLDRKEEGTSLRTRARLTRGSLEVSASLGTSFRRHQVTPWYATTPNDPRGYNAFLDEVALRTGADTLMLPARVRLSRTRENGYEAVGGLNWRLPGGRGTLGAEVHRWRRTWNDRSFGTGPQPTGWDVRAGGEYRLSDTFKARAGWSHGLADRDNLVLYNTYRHTTATTGFGLQPWGAKWSVDLGYAHEWVSPDFVEPTRSRETRRRLAIQARWPF